jgi:NAD(P) transhydrogenase subunit alpha
MSLIIGVLKETVDAEKRVAASPDTVKKYIALGAQVVIEKNAGLTANILDADFKNAGATIGSAADIAKKSDILLCVQTPKDTVVSSLKKGALLVGALAPHDNPSAIKNWAKSEIVACAMELMPRITRAQSMDILSSQSNLSGYKSVLDATEHFARAFPMMMTAAGTIAPTKVFVMGAGVAGLQAIATAKRLGAIVTATDVRPASKEQVESLGGIFVAVEDDEFKQAETSGGYAKPMSAAYQKKQATLVAEHIAKQDIVITTALIPGRDAPTLVTEAMVKSMKAGSVIVDLAVERGGNCDISEVGKVVEKHGVKIIGHKNVPSRIAADSSLLYSKNLLTFVTLLIDKETNKLSINWDDEIVQGVALTKDGVIVHSTFAEKKTATPVKKATPKKAPAKKKPTAKKAPAKKAPTKTTTKKKVK